VPFDDHVLGLCDRLWASDARLQAAQLYLATFTGFGTERVQASLQSLQGLRADRELIDRLGLGAVVESLIQELERSLD